MSITNRLRLKIAIDTLSPLFYTLNKGVYMDIVEVKKEHVFCDSSIVARKFGLKHAYVVRAVNNLVDELDGLRVISNHPKVLLEEREYRGNHYTAYLMDRAFFSLLAMRFKGKKALEWQIKFNDAFYEMERKILQTQVNSSDQMWLGIRDTGKVARLEETDAIKQFVEYATDQGSTKAKYYYKHITNATYKALDLMAQKKPRLRDSMDIYEVSQLLLAEKLAKDQILKYMGLGRNYKDIYESVKNDLILFSDSFRLFEKKESKK